MRAGSEMLRSALTGSFSHHWEADVYYAGERRMVNVPLTSFSAREDANAKVQQSASCTVVWSDDFGRSVLPEFPQDTFAPFGAELQVFCVVEAGPFTERVEFGWFVITDVPAARDEWMRFQGSWFSAGSMVELELKERLASLGAESFDVPTAPAALGSAWDEVGRISGFVLDRAVSDQPVPRSVLYENNRLDALYSLMDVVLGAVPHMRADGVLSARPNVWPQPVDRIGLDCLIDVGSVMSSAQVYNRVVVRANGAESVLAVAEVTSGPLRVRNSDGSRSPFGARTKYLSSEFVTTRPQAERWAQETLAQVSVLRTQTVPVVEVFNPLRERGDVVLVERPDVWLLGRVVTVDRGEASQRLTVEVAGRLPKDPDTRPAWPNLFALYPSSVLFPSVDLFPVRGGGS